MNDLEAHIAKLREDFSKGTLDENAVSPEPAKQFRGWLQQAVESKIAEAHAMTLCTVGKENKPSSRIVYLREFENDQYWFYTNYKSRKAKDVEFNPNVSLLFYWKELERQVRIDGTITKASTQRSDAYFDARPYASKIGAWSSHQSEQLTSREALEKKLNETHARFTEETIVRPDFWGGYVVRATYYEFWQGRPSRLHDRISYSFQNDGWTLSRLSP